MSPADRLRLRDALVAALQVRKGETLDEGLIQDRANNGVMYLEEVVDSIVTAALKDAARGEVVTGTIDGAQPHAPITDEPPVRSRYFFDDTKAEQEEETPEEMAKRFIK